jgi:hypothetical protein
MNYQEYEFTRTIRFTLTGENKDVLVKDLSNNDRKEVFSDFQRTYDNLLSVFKEAVFYKSDDNKLKVKSRLEIKKSWLRRYARGDFYAIDERKRQGKSKFQAMLFERVLNEWLERNRELWKKINKMLILPQESQAKKSDLSLLLRQLKSAEYFPFIRDFAQPGIANNKNSNECLEELQSVVDQFETLLDQAFFFTAPDLNNGVETARASFNYYTINKISKNFDKDIEYKKKQLSVPYQGLLKDELFLRKVGFLEYLKNEYKKDLRNVSLEQLYEALKKFKSKQKAAFMREVQRGVYDGFLLFEIKKPDTLKKFIDITNEIENLAVRKNQVKQEAEKEKLRNEIMQKKIKRGVYFQKPWGFPNYVVFCNNEFRPVAMAIGKLKAEIMALEQEKVEARLLKYWAHIVKKDSQYFLLLIPKEKMQDAKRFLDELDKSLKEDGEYILYSFNSLTLRALNKLIRTNLDKEQTRLQTDAVTLYQEVLRGKYPKLQNLDFNGFDKEIKAIAENSYVNEEEFRFVLERAAYYRFEKKLSEETIDKLRNDFNTRLFKISAYDFERKIMGEMKEHPKLWQKFWESENQKEQFPVRLNPELRLFYRPKREQKDPKKQKNRFSKEHFGAAFTITQNAAKKRIDTAFAQEKALLEMVRKFNEEVISIFIREKGDDLYYYGIDRGQRELATLCVVRFSKEQYEVMLKDGTVKKFDKPIPAPIKLYRIKDEHLQNSKEIVIDSAGNKKAITMFKNPSYFIDDKEKFEEIESPCIDLTIAKLIKGKIVLNGDIRTYIELKKASGKRQLFEKFAKIDCSARIEFDEVEKRFQIKSKPTEKEREPYQFLPYYQPRQEKIVPRAEIQKDFQEYLNKLCSGERTEEDISIEKINHLRDAITSNMVGIIAFLFEQFPGIINLENLHSRDDIERHFRKSNEDISRRLEWSLYKKFQKFGLVPPRLRQTVFLRENELKEGNRLNQFGIIHFIPTEGTSARCPYCSTKNTGKERKEEKFKEHAFICKACEFNTENPKPPFEFIKNSDDVGAYNIAKERI